MTVSTARVGLVLLLAWCTFAPSDQLSGQEPRGPIDLLLDFVRDHVRTNVPPEMRPYQITRMFLRVGPRALGSGLLGSLEKQNLERRGVTLLEDTVKTEPAWAGGVIVLDSVKGSANVRDDGLYVVLY